MCLCDLFLGKIFCQKGVRRESQQSNEWGSWAILAKWAGNYQELPGNNQTGLQKSAAKYHLKIWLKDTKPIISILCQSKNQWEPE